MDIQSLPSDLETRELAAGETLIEQGTSTGHVYILESGTLEVLRDEKAICDVDEAGAPLGEISMLLDTPHQATVRAKTDVKVHVIDDFESVAENNPAVLMELTQTLAQRLTSTNEVLASARKEFESLLVEHGDDDTPTATVQEKFQKAWERFGEVMRTEIADF
ncbi:MAG: cyclic nucleotide-binding domain-containing protein [Phycisphaeraceae bacterium]|nr:cyclic nucleotide-binding domain-containing protein [Phycisphaeraceae bacterium]